MIFSAPPVPADTGLGNSTIQSFNTAKKTLERQVYYDHRETIYCGVQFHENKKTNLPLGFESKKHKQRCNRIEWEHVLPAENFGRTFKEWRDGDPQCVDSKGKSFRGRKCASKVNLEYRYMQSDLYNLYPAVGCVNAQRSNFNFTMLPSAPSVFGACEMKIEGSKAEPPAEARGQIARTYQYMDWAYPRYKMSSQQRKLMQAWDKMYPISPWECSRAKRIKLIQKNSNPFIEKPCEQAKLW